MNELFRIDVACYSGYKTDEYPVFFYWDDIRFDIEEILDRWYQYDRRPEFPAADYFKVRTTDQKVYILKHEIESDWWYLWIKGESMNL